MKKIIFLLISVVLTASVDARAASLVKHRILYLNSYENGYAWSDNIFDGIRSTLQDSGMEIDLQIEYMDTKKYFDRQIEQSLFTHYQYKFRQTRFDIVITSDNNAFEFMCRYRDRLTPGVPLVFCGLNDFRAEMLAGHQNVTGVIENIRFDEIMNMALRLHPDARRLIVIGDESATGKAIANQIKTALPVLNDRLQTEFWTGFDHSKILQQVRSIPKDSILYLVPFYEDIHGEFYSAREVLASIYENTSVPIYSNWDFLMGYGIVGGTLTSGRWQGSEAARMAIRILNGEDISLIPIVTESRHTPVFDYNVLSAFHLQADQLPEGSRIINQPYHFYKLNRQVFWVIMISLFFLILITISLIITIIQKRAAETKYRSIFENASRGIFIASLNGRFINVNQAFARILGYDSEEEALAQLNTEASLYASSRQRDEFWEQMRNGDEVSEFEMEYIRRDGDASWGALSAHPVYDKKGKILHIECVAEDITKRKQAEMALMESRQTLRLILDNIPQLVYWENKELRYMGVNKSFMEFLGIDDPRSVIGRNVGDVVASEEYTRKIIKLDRQVIQSNRPQYGIKLSLKSFSDELVWIEVNKIPLHDAQGRAVGILTTAEDITRKVNLERQLRQAQKMEALGILSGGIAHDFNNILTSIINSTELAIEDVPADSMTEKDLERVLKAADRGSQLVQQILTFSRATQEGFQPIDINAVVNDALELIKASLPGNIKVIENIQQTSGLCVADPIQIHQIVMNLCTNSIQALEDRGGQLEIGLEKAEVDISLAEMLTVKPGRYWKLSIADNGPGIPFEIIDKIFDPFFTTKEKGKGTGLGLAVVHGIVKSHNGGISVTSTPWERSRFEIFLPRDRYVDVSAEKAVESLAQGRERILFVEDDEDQRVTIPRVLQKLGYEVTSAGNALEALDKFSNSPVPFDLVITDFDMPETNGFELASGIGKISPETPVIIVSGRERAASVEIAGNIRAIVSKPYNRSDISKVIRKILDHQAES